MLCFPDLCFRIVTPIGKSSSRLCRCFESTCSPHPNRSTTDDLSPHSNACPFATLLFSAARERPGVCLLSSRSSVSTSRVGCLARTHPRTPQVLVVVASLAARAVARFSCCPKSISFVLVLLES